MNDLLPLLGASPGTTVLMLAAVGASLFGLFVSPALIERNLFRPHWVFRQRQYATLFTSAFLHADIGHLFFNMFTMWAFAFQLEREMGTASFLALYVFGLLASDLGTYLQHRQDPGYRSLGASGAISAVLFASIVYFPSASLMIMPIPVPIPAPLFALGYLAYSYYASRQASGHINHDAHLAGALSGLVFVGLLDPERFKLALHSLGV